MFDHRRYRNSYPGDGRSESEYQGEGERHFGLPIVLKAEKTNPAELIIITPASMNEIDLRHRRRASSGVRLDRCGAQYWGVIRDTPNGTNRPGSWFCSLQYRRNDMRMKLLVAAAGFAACATPALAEFYIVHDTGTKHCTIVEQRPTTETTVVVGDSRYTTRQEAEGAMRTVKVCESGGTVGGPVAPPARGPAVAPPPPPVPPPGR